MPTWSERKINPRTGMYDRYDPQLRVFFQDYDSSQDFDWSGRTGSDASPMSSLAKMGSSQTAPTAPTAPASAPGAPSVAPAGQSAASASAGGSGAGIGGGDIAGMGLQLLGAGISDRRAREERDRLEAIRKEDIARATAQGNRDRQDSLRQKAEENSMLKRGQNQKGLDFLNGLVDDNRAQGYKRSFNEAVLHHGGY